MRAPFAQPTMAWGQAGNLGQMLLAEAAWQLANGGDVASVYNSFASHSDIGAPPTPEKGESELAYMSRVFGTEFTPGLPTMVQLGNSVESYVTGTLNDFLGAFTGGEITWSDIINSGYAMTTVHGSQPGLQPASPQQIAQLNAKVAALNAAVAKATGQTGTYLADLGVNLARSGSSVGAKVSSPQQVAAAAAKAPASSSSSSGSAVAIVAGGALLLFLLSRR